MDKLSPDLTAEELCQRALKWTNEQWRNEIAKLTPEQVMAVLPLASVENDPGHWQQKIISAIEGMRERAALEAAGKILSVEQCSVILSQTLKEEALHVKLVPIFVGMPHEIFWTLFTSLTPEQLAPLKQEAFTEAIQHHLTLIVHELTKQIGVFQSMLLAKEKELQNLALDDLGLEEIHNIYRDFDELHQYGILALKSINCALAIAWNTPRLDLIEHLSDLKEKYQRIIHFQIGISGEEPSNVSSLRGLFEKLTQSIFSEHTPSQGIDIFPDDLPAVEALVKFGVWYLKDYWEIGLLPHIKNATQLDFEAASPSAKKQNYHEQLFVQVNKNLERVGLSTLADLKRLKIYSKKALKEYIASQNTLLPSDKK